jgi:hypothetical protein
MPRTISDQEDAWLRNKVEVANFAESIWGDPALNEDAKRLAKRKYPQLEMKDIELKDQFEARFAEERKIREDAENARREAAEHQDWQDKRKATQKRYGMTDEAMSDMEKWMIDRNVGDYEVAAGYRIQREPKVSDGNLDTARWQYEKQPGWAEIAKDPEAWGRAEILKAIRADEETARGQGF